METSGHARRPLPCREQERPSSTEPLNTSSVPFMDRTSLSSIAGPARNRKSACGGIGEPCGRSSRCAPELAKAVLNPLCCALEEASYGDQHPSGSPDLRRGGFGDRRHATARPC